MKIRYREIQDPRITKKKSFIKEYMIIMAIMLVCCSGAVLMFNEMMIEEANPWYMAWAISSYVFFMGLLVSLIVRFIMYPGYVHPISEIGSAARKVAAGDFTVRILPKRKDGKKDNLEVLIEDFNKMVQELATIETLKTDFIANISHEMKTPLAIIQSYASALESDTVSPEMSVVYAQTIRESSKKLADLVTNILRLNKLESQAIICKEQFSLDEQIRCCILAMDEKLEEKNLELDVELEEVQCLSDPSLLEIVWNNLLNNAIKFTEPGGTVGIKLAVVKEEHILVTISDTGCGMAEETCRRIFDRFYQGDTSHAGEGNGLGLALVRRVLDLVDGDIQVESKVSVGTEFTVTLKMKEI